MTRVLPSANQLFIIVAASATLFACKQPAKPVNNQKQVASRTPTSRPTSRPVKRQTTSKWTYARPKDEWAKARASEAKTRLQATPAGKLLWKALHAAGGLEHWYKQGPITFHFRYAPLSKKKRARDTVQTIDTWSSKGFHHVTKTPNIRFGWDGKQAWRLPKGKKQALNARFWTLTPFYFIGIPFVLADKGIVLQMETHTSLNKRKCHLIRASFKAGTGDAPKDYYKVYIDKKTFRVLGVRYIVSYPGFFPKGGHSPEKLMTYDGTQTVNGITFPKTFRTYQWNAKRNRKTRLVTRSLLDTISFSANRPATDFHPPKDAEILKGY